MAKYLISFGDDFENNKIVEGKANLDQQLLDLFCEGVFSEGEEPSVYELGKKMTAEVETKVVVKGEPK